MELRKLYEIADRENITVHNWHIEDVNGIYLNYDKINAIALNYDRFGTYIEEKCTLAEELGHFYMDADYHPLYSDNNYKSKQEYRAKKWSYNVLVNIEELKKAIKSGITYITELAEYFEVTVQYMKDCIEYYQSKGLLDCNI